MLITIIPILMIFGGGVLYALAANPKVSEIGRLILAAGLFAFAFALSSRTVSL